MNKYDWNHKTWILNEKYPKKTQLYVIMILLSCIILFGIIFVYRYPIYQTFYGYVEENGNSKIKIVVPIDELENFEESLKKNEEIELLNVTNEMDIISGKNIVYASTLVAIDEKLLVKNNIVPIKLKVKEVNLWQEFSQKWKGLMK